MHYKYFKINPNQGGSYINSPDWIKNKKVTINPINKKDKKCFQYVITVALNHEEIKTDPEKIKIKRFANEYKWGGIHFPSEKNNWKKTEKDNVTTAPKALYAEKEEKYLAYVSKCNSNCEKQVILLMISNS